MYKKLIIIMMIVLLGSLSAHATGGKETGKTSGAQVTTEGTDVDYYMKFDPVITLTQPQVADDGKTYPEGDDETDNVFTRWAEENVGINWEPKYTYTTEDESKQKLALAMASLDMPDLLFLDSTDVSKLAKGGLIMPIQDLMDKYLSPLSKYMLDEIDDSLQGQFYTALSYNGEAYAIPYYQDNVCPNFAWYRKDLLDELGLEVPETIAEFDNMLKVYKAAYPDGVGLILDKSLVNGFYMIMDAFGANPRKWMKDAGGNLVYGSVQPEVKEGLAQLRDWYAKGYLDREFIVKDGAKAQEPWQAGDAMVIEGAWWLSWGTNIDLYHNVNSSVLAGGPYLKGPGGDLGPRIQVYNNRGYVISAQCENPEAVLIQFNHYLDSAYRGHKDLQDQFDFIYPYEEPRTAINMDEVSKLEAENKVAFRKYDYSMPGPRNGSDGDFFNVGLNWARQYGILLNQRAYQLRNQFLRIANAWETDTLDSMRDADKKAYDGMFRGVAPLRVSHFGNMKLSVEMEPNVKISEFMGPPTEAMIQYNAYLQKIELETFANIIIGESPLDVFDKFVEDWQKNGGDKITEEVNAWYEEVMG